MHHAYRCKFESGFSALQSWKLDARRSNFLILNVERSPIPCLLPTARRSCGPAEPHQGQANFASRKKSVRVHSLDPDPPAQNVPRSPQRGKKSGGVERWRGGESRSVSTSRSSNRTCGSPASGSRRRFTLSHAASPFDNALAWACSAAHDF